MKVIDKTTILLFMYVDICVLFGCYMYLRRVKHLVGFQLGMNISIVMAGMTAFLFGVLLILQFPFHFTLVTIVTTLLGLMTGALFGRLFDYQTAVTGLTNGMAIGLMSPMIGTVVEMPSLFVWFIHIFFALCLVTIVISIKRS